MLLLFEGGFYWRVYGSLAANLPSCDGYIKAIQCALKLVEKNGTWARMLEMSALASVLGFDVQSEYLTQSKLVF